MNKIIKMSNNGFQLDLYSPNVIDVKSEYKKWFTCDKKKIIDSGRFNELKLNVELEDIKIVKGKDDKEYVIDFKVISKSELVDSEIYKEMKFDKKVMALSKKTYDEINSQSSPSINIKPPVSCSEGRDTSTLKVVEGVSILESDGGKQDPPNNKVNSLKSPSSIQDNILYGQCINIVFAWAKDKTTHDLSIKEDRLYLKNLVNELFNDLRRD